MDDLTETSTVDSTNVSLLSVPRQFLVFALDRMTASPGPSQCHEYREGIDHFPLILGGILIDFAIALSWISENNDTVNQPEHAM